MKNRIFIGEFVGSAFLVMIIVGSGIMAQNLTRDFAVMLLANTLATGAGLFVLINSIANISAELIATFGLIFIILGALKKGSTSGAASVATYITAGYWFTSSTSFANPAVALARTFTDTFTGINYLNTPSYIVAEIIGALLALFVIKKIISKK